METTNTSICEVICSLAQRRPLFDEPLNDAFDSSNHSTFKALEAPVFELESQNYVDYFLHRHETLRHPARPLDHQQAARTRMVKGIGCDRDGALPSLLPSRPHTFGSRGRWSDPREREIFDTLTGGFPADSSHLIPRCERRQPLQNRQLIKDSNRLIAAVRTWLVA